MDLILLISPTKCNGTPWIFYIKQSEKTLKGGEKIDWLGTSLSEERQSGESPEFSFSLRDPRLDAGVDSNSEMPTDRNK